MERKKRKKHSWQTKAVAGNRTSLGGGTISREAKTVEIGSSRILIRVYIASLTNHAYRVRVDHIG